MTPEQRHYGFTLIELMIVIAVLAIITAIAVPVYNGYIQTSRQTEGWNNLQSLKLAEEEYFLENNTYFLGASTSDINANSGGLWSPAESDADRNFEYAVQAGRTGSISTSYAATATGRGSGYKVPSSVTLDVGN